MSIRKQGNSNIAYDYLYNAIISQELVPGQAIIEQSISDLLGISRTPIREALTMLEMEGLVYRIPSKGSFVKEIMVQDVEEIFELRIMFETMAIRRAVSLISAEELDEIEVLLLKANNSLEDEVYYESDRYLHNTLMKYSKNNVMQKFYSTIEGHFERFRHVSAMAPKRLDSSREEHMEILKAIRNRDVVDAEKKLLNHLERVKENSIKVCQNQRFGI